MRTTTSSDLAPQYNGAGSTLAVAAGAGRPRVAATTWAITRIALGFIFAWAFVDKAFGFGFATPSADSWVNGGSPTTGYLAGVQGPFGGIFNAVSGQAWADWLFMGGLLAVGVALLAGVAMRLAAVGGVTMLIMMWMASMPMVTNPAIDDHVVYALVLVGLAAAGAGHTFGLGDRWNALPLVRRFPVLR